MEFVSANPSVVRSIKQRVLLNTWLRALGASATAATCWPITGPTASPMNWPT